MRHPLAVLGPLVFEKAPDALFLLDLEHERFLDANPAALALAGQNGAELLQRPPRALLRSDSGEPLPDRFFPDVLRHRSTYSARLLLRREPDQAAIPTEADLSVLSTEPEWCALLTLRDLRGQREAEVLLRALIDSIPDLIYYKDGAGIFRGCNAAFEKYIGRAEAELTGKTELDLFPRDVGERHLGRDRRVLAAGTPLRSEEWLHYPDGRRVLVEEMKTPLVGPDGQSLGLLGIGRDITQRRELEEQLRHAQKMEAVGQLAGGIAHDFNNLLTVILGNLSLLLNSDVDPNAAKDLLGATEKAGWRAAELIRQLLSFSRQTMLRTHPTNLNAVVEEIVSILRRTIDPRVVLHFAPQPDLWLVPADQNQLHQILMNLGLNARDAMPNGGDLRFELKNVVVDEEFAERHPEARPGEFVRLSAGDTGHGIPPEILPRIFEPFFTTKGVGKGTGLGLAMVFGILKQHEGWIECTSHVGSGTRFDLYFPRLRQPRTTPTPAALAGGSETVLVVDDEAGIREQCSLILRTCGYRVLLAVDGQEAVRIYERAAPRVDLVLLDCVMPHLSGHETLERLRAVDPQVRVLLSSGYAAEHVVAESGARGFIAKPYRADELAKAVRAALEKPPNG